MPLRDECAAVAESRQRTADRQGYANGFKPKTLKTGVGRVDLRIPQTGGYRDENGRQFYPRSFERGVRSERAMTLAVWIACSVALIAAARASHAPGRSPHCAG